MQVRKQQLELDMEQWTGSKLEKEAIKAVLEKAMAPHSRTLAWKILWTEEPGRLQSMRSLWVRHE